LLYAALLCPQEHADVTRSVPHFARLAGFPEGAELTGLEPEAFQRGLHTAFAEWLEDLARERPTPATDRHIRPPSPTPVRKMLTNSLKKSREITPKVNFCRLRRQL